MKDQKENAVAVRSEMTKTMQAIDEKLKNLKAVTDSPFKTSGQFSFSGGLHSMSNTINIHKLSDLRLMLGILAALTNHKNNYDNAAKLMEITSYPEFEWLGFPYDSWVHDIKVRLAVITHHETRSKLESAKKKLETFLTEEDRLAIVLKDINNIL